MWIEVLINFKDGTDAFYAEEKRLVGDERGNYFVEQGWAKNLDPNAETVEVATAPASVDLAVDGSFIGHKAEGTEVKHG